MRFSKGLNPFMNQVYLYDHLQGIVQSAVKWVLIPL